jgi:hypothetical protein
MRLHQLRLPLRLLRLVHRRLLRRLRQLRQHLLLRLPQARLRLRLRSSLRRRKQRLVLRLLAAVLDWCGSIRRAMSTTATARIFTARPRPGLICLRLTQRPRALIRTMERPAASNLKFDAAVLPAPLMPVLRLQGRWLIKRIISRKMSPEIWRECALILSRVSLSVWW